jgi:hypothetical protein
VDDRQRREDQQPGGDATFRDDAQVVERHADRGDRREQNNDGYGQPELVAPENGASWRRMPVFQIRPGAHPARVAECRLTQQVQLAGPGDGLGAVGGPELAVDVVDVRLDRAHRDEEVFGDLGVGPTGGQECKDLQLPFAQRFVGLPGRSRIYLRWRLGGFEGCIRCRGRRAGRLRELLRSLTETGRQRFAVRLPSRHQPVEDVRN